MKLVRGVTRDGKVGSRVLVFKATLAIALTCPGQIVRLIA